MRRRSVYVRSTLLPAPVQWHWRNIYLLRHRALPQLLPAVLRDLLLHEDAILLRRRLLRG